MIGFIICTIIKSQPHKEIAMKKFISFIITSLALNIITPANAVLVTGTCQVEEKITAYTIPENKKEKSKILDIEQSNFDRYVISTIDYYGKVAVTNGKKTYVFNCKKTNANECIWHGANFR